MSTFAAPLHPPADQFNGQCDCACPDGSQPGGRENTPRVVYLELTPACNNGCAGCPNAVALPPAFFRAAPLRFDGWAEIVSRLLPGLQRVKLTGGEPTLHPDFPRIVSFLDELALPFDLFSNGRWTSPPALLNLLKSNHSFGGCLISLHGPDARSHEAFSQVPGSFAETLENIRQMVAMNIPVVLSTIITGQNHMNVDEMLALGRQAGASYHVFNRYLGPPLKGISPTPDQLRKAVRDIEIRRGQGWRTKFSVCIPQCFTPSSSLGCLAGKAACTIDPWGNLRPCSHATLVIGNLLQRSLDELWHSPALESWGELPAFCQGCPQASTCQGGCRAQALLEHTSGDPLVTSPIRSNQPPLPASCRYTELKEI